MSAASAWLIDISLRNRLESLDVQPDHAVVAACLSKAIDGTNFHLALEDRHQLMYRDGRILDDAGAQVAADAKQWIEQQVQDAGLGRRSRLVDLAAGKLLRTSVRIMVLYFVARISLQPEHFFQVVVHCETEYPSSRSAASYGSLSSPHYLRDLCNPDEPDETQSPIGAARYRLRAVECMRDFVIRDAAIQQERYPQTLREALERHIAVIDEDTGMHLQTSWAEAFGYPQQFHVTRLQRWFKDWQSSSAGGTCLRLEDHWVFQLTEGVSKQGERYSEAIPRWVTQGDLPSYGKASLHTDSALRDWLRCFDVKAGYPFAWFFFMLHGDRISTEAGMRVAEGIEHGHLWLPSHDREVLHAWALSPYGF